MNGSPTYVTRVESWECDFNGHWNARYYGRSFQNALENVAFRSIGKNPGNKGLKRRLVRFHSELLSSDLVQIQSWWVSSGRHAGSVLHAMTSNGRLAATALDVTDFQMVDLPDTSDVAIALPRTIPFAEVPDFPNQAFQVNVDPIQASDLDAMGGTHYEDIIRRCAVGTHSALDHLGFNRDLTNQTGISRMAVEHAVWRLEDAPVGMPTRVHTALHSIRSKSFSYAQLLETFDGQTIAVVEGCIVAVDLNTRRAVELPAAFREAVAAYAR